MRTLRVILALGSVIILNCSSPEPAYETKELPIIRAILPEVYINGDGVRWECFTYPMRNLAGIVTHYREYCQ